MCHRTSDLCRGQGPQLCVMRTLAAAATATPSNSKYLPYHRSLSFPSLSLFFLLLFSPSFLSSSPPPLHLLRVQKHGGGAKLSHNTVDLSACRHIRTYRQPDPPIALPALVGCSLVTPSPTLRYEMVLSRLYTRCDPMAHPTTIYCNSAPQRSTTTCNSGPSSMCRTLLPSL